MGCVVGSNVLQASTRLPLLINPQTHEPPQYVTVTGNSRRFVCSAAKNLDLQAMSSFCQIVNLGLYSAETGIFLLLFDIWTDTFRNFGEAL
ncbi:hypothetical protein RJ639_016006 [Escallonia herrerae]|uniref:Uncharacterized protein n=1 Tax=Escallonia herrerae TaxID=1293975 RepID=A0AA88VDS9_9ASTE|nr:hypothetical protein RJ639_016006 [Escallonia herrerae]